ncbi:MAG: glycosyltransferase [Parasulfuritortus sp.]|nr:glycosyltransferase [Parasulfuritortus sp.]
MKHLDFFRSVNAPYYIYGLDYRQSSAGVRVLHYLCHALNELGEEAYISANVTSPYLRTPRLTNKIVNRHAQSGRMPIALYPEVVPGNPFQSAVVARWILNKPGHIGGETVFAPGEILFAYQGIYIPEGSQAHFLYIPAVDGRIFHNRDGMADGKRQGACFYAHKYLVFGGKLTEHAKDAVSLCQDIPRSHEEIADILRQSEVLYSYEPSAIVTEALHCGCPVVIVPSRYLEENYDYGQLHGPGVEVGFDAHALERAKASLANFDTVSQLVFAESTLRGFVEITQQRMVEHACTLKAGNETGQLLAPSYQPDEYQSKYDLWRQHHQPEVVARGLMTTGTGQQEKNTVFQIVIPLPENSAASLEPTLVSIASQLYPYWRVNIVSLDAPPTGFVNTENIVWVTLSRPDFIHAYNEILDAVEFDWLYVLEAGDVLASHALFSLATQAVKHPEWGVMYGDEDSLEANGVYGRPLFRSAVQIDMQRAAPFSLSGAVAVRRDVLLALSGFRPEFSGAEYYDLLLRAFEKLGQGGFGHIADVLYHRSIHGGHAAQSAEDVIQIRRHALQEHLANLDLPADIEDGVLPGTFRIRYRHDGDATVSIIIPTLNGGVFLQRCIGAIVENTDYKNWEIIIVDQESDDPNTLQYLGLLDQMEGEVIRVLKHPRTENLPALINAGARLARGKFLLFMADATAPLRRDWLDEMLGYGVQPGVGVVGAKMIGPDANISFAGYVLGLEGLPAGLHDLHAPPDALGYFGRLQVPGNPSAVSATCMLTEKALFEELGGFDEKELAGGYSDVDYCLRAGKAGRRVVWTPHALLLQEHMFQPPKTAKVEDDEDEAEPGQKRFWRLPTIEAQVMFDRWMDRIAFDPAYNRNLSLASGAFEIETMPALTWDPELRPVPRILAHSGDRAGCGEYRIIAPLRALMNSGRVQGWETADYLSVPELARMSPDTVVFQRQVKWNQLKLMEIYVRNTKAFRVYELDDLMTNVQVSNQARKDFQHKNLVKYFRQALDMCDRFVVSTDYLADEYRKFKNEIRVAPNCLERAKWGGFTPKRRQGRKPRVGWAGSVSHEGDLALIADVVKTLSDEVEWVFMALCPEGVRKLVEYHAGVPINDYPAKLASLNLDLALAPLEDVPFNHAKSHLRLLEYGVLGYPVICTDITPYRGAYPVTRVKNRFKDWVEAIREHVSDMDELARRGDTLRDYINANWMLEDNLDTWLKAWLPS